MKKSIQILNNYGKTGVFIFFFFLSLLICNTAFASPQSEYDTYKVELNRLREDAKRSQLRHYWLDLADDFYTLYEKNPSWVNRPAALFRAAEAYDELAKRSFAKKDTDEALRLYEMVIKNYPKSVLADDAYYYAARVYQEQVRDTAKAQQYLDILLSKYAKEDHAPLAKEYRDKLVSSETASINPDTLTLPSGSSVQKAYMMGITASQSKDVIKIKVQIDAKNTQYGQVAWSVDYQPPNTATNSPPRLVLTLTSTQPHADAKAGYKFSSMGILSRFVVDYSQKNSTVVLFDFTQLAAYYAYFDKTNSVLVIETTAKSSALANGILTEKVKSQKIAQDIKNFQDFVPKDIALQLGLEVKTIIIDPGHGGKDPGTAHNDIIEKDLVLDISKKIGEELSKLGYKVKYTRTKDVFLSLTERADFAKNNKGDLIISIHANASGNSKISGIETYFLDSSSLVSGTGALRLGEMETMLNNLAIEARVYESKRLADYVHEFMLTQVSKQGLNVSNGGTKASPLSVLSNSTMPGILVEVGYCSNSQDAKLMKNTKYISALARGISSGIHQYANNFNLAKK